MQKIEYNKRKSKFKNIVLEHLRAMTIPQLKDDLEINFTKNGYNGNLIIEISEEDYFYANSSFSDISRFPARIKATASALKSLNFFGKFNITHYNGILRISQI
ncbi:hypothetical protein CKA56_12155 [Arcobacter venerupis]|nr:hypothetical protein [Arcobacter venerupis]RWS48883.1 hypothetical protein CKA56_12155 [Arcobacter venerupis]